MGDRSFTVGRDRVDLYLAKHDMLGSMAHITMLESIGLLTAGELEMLLAELRISMPFSEKVCNRGWYRGCTLIVELLTRKLEMSEKKILVDIHCPVLSGFETVCSCS